MQAQNAGFGYAIPGGFYYGTANSADGSGSPGANFAEYESLSGGSVQVSQFVSALNDNGLQDDSGITAVQIVGDPIPTAYSPTALANAVNVTANSTLDVTGASTASVGNLAIGGNTLSVTGGGSGLNSNYFLTAGATHLTGNATFNVANNGTGEGTLTLGSVDQDGTPRSLTKVGAGMLVLSGTDTYTGGTTVLAGTLVVGNASGLETGTSLTVGTWPAGGGGGGTAARAGAEVSAVPEPGTSALLLSALVAAACLWRRRKQGSARGGLGGPSYSKWLGVVMDRSRFVARMVDVAEAASSTIRPPRRPWKACRSWSRCLGKRVSPAATISRSTSRTTFARPSNACARRAARKSPSYSWPTRLCAGGPSSPSIVSWAVRRRLCEAARRGREKRWRPALFG